MSTRIPNIQKNKKFNFEDGDVTPNVQEQMPIKFDYPFKSRKSKDRKKDMFKEEIEERVIMPSPVLEKATSLSDSTQIENQRLSIMI